MDLLAEERLKQDIVGRQSRHQKEMTLSQDSEPTYCTIIDTFGNSKKTLACNPKRSWLIPDKNILDNSK